MRHLSAMIQMIMLYTKCHIYRKTSVITKLSEKSNIKTPQASYDLYQQCQSYLHLHQKDSINQLVGFRLRAYRLPI